MYPVVLGMQRLVHIPVSPKPGPLHLHEDSHVLHTSTVNQLPQPETSEGGARMKEEEGRGGERKGGEEREGREGEGME